MASACIDMASRNSKPLERVKTFSKTYLGLSPSRSENLRRSVLLKAARYRIWHRSSHLGYLQCAFKANRGSFSLFDSSYAWKRDLVFSSPSLLQYVKEESTREYLHTLCAVRDSYLGVLEGSPEHIQAFIKLISDRKKDLIQDIRKGHVLDRYPETSVPLIHPLRMEIEGFLFGASGPDPDRSSYIEKVLKSDKQEGLLQSLFPFLECIVDYSNDVEGREALRTTAPDVPIICPLIFAGETPIGLLSVNDSDYILDPFLLNEIRLESHAVGSEHTINVFGEIVRLRVVGLEGDVPKVHLIMK